MFRRFTIINKMGEEDEALINLDHIIAIAKDKDKVKIICSGGDYIESAIEYKHLVDALSNIQF